MRRSGLSKVISGLVLAGVALTGLQAEDAAAGPSDVCDPVGDALFEAGEAALARDAYIKALTANPQMTCVSARLKVIADVTTNKQAAVDQATCERAKDLADVGKRKEAEALYVEILKGRQEPCAREGLAGLRSEPKAVERARDWLAPIASVSALGATILVAGLALGALVFIAISYSGPVRRLMKRSKILGWPFRPRLGVVAFGATGVKIGVSSGVTGLVRMHLSHLAKKQQQGGSDYRLDRITGVEGIATAVGGLAALAPQFKALSALITAVPQLARLPRYKLHGELQEATGAGAGLTVILDKQHSQGEGATLWTRATPADAAGYQALAAGAAGWADFLIREREGLQRPAYTNNAEGYAYLRTGIQLELDEQKENARRAYVSAVKADPSNVAALLNLSVAEAWNQDYDEAINLLEMAESVLEGQ
jgi:tetratricopeptide (TPR) repeat protein